MVSPVFFERFVGEKGIFKRNRLISTGAVVGAGCPSFSFLRASDPDVRAAHSSGRTILFSVEELRLVPFFYYFFNCCYVGCYLFGLIVKWFE